MTLPTRFVIPRISIRHFCSSAQAFKKVTQEQVKARQEAIMRKSLPKKREIPGVNHVVLVASGKGGVGKSTTAVNLSLSLSRVAKRPLSVGLLDADVFGPSVPTMMNLTRQTEIYMSKQNKMIPIQNYGVKVMSIGLMVAESDAVVWRGPMVMGAIEKMIHQTDWACDILVVDLPPGTGDIHLSIAQTLQVSGAIVVSTPQKVALADTRKGVSMFGKVDIPVLGIVQNMSGHVCSHCGEVSHVFGRDGAAKLATDLGVTLLGDVPLDSTVMETSDSGRPVVLSHPDSTPARCYKNIALKVLDELLIEKT